MREYEEARARIFGEGLTKSSKLEKSRERYKERKEVRKEIAAASLYEGEDTRMYLKIKIADQEVEGLLDSGATITCLGKGCVEFVEKAGIPIYSYSAVNKTAYGTRHPINGRIRAMIKCNKIEREINFYLVPTLSRRLYLGIDCMRVFKLIINLDYLASDDVPLADEGDAEEKIPTKHILSANESEVLESVIAEFPSFERLGLGKTDIEMHIIDTSDAAPVKQRHYPVSPAVQQLMFTELD